MDVNSAKLRDLAGAYQAAESERERRLVEIGVLDTILWQSENHDADAIVGTYTEEEIETIPDALDENAGEAGAVLRRPYLETL